MIAFRDAIEFKLILLIMIVLGITMEVSTNPTPPPSREGKKPVFNHSQINLTVGSNNELKKTEFQLQIYLVNRACGKLLTVYENGTLGSSPGRGINNILIKYSAGPGSVVGLMFKVNNMSVCVNATGDLFVRKVSSNHTDCRWKEEMRTNQFYTYYSYDHVYKRKIRLYLGMNRNGTIRNAIRTRRTQQFSQFGIVRSNKGDVVTSPSQIPSVTRDPRIKKCRCVFPRRRRCKKKCSSCLKKGECRIIKRRCRDQKCKDERRRRKRKRLQKRCKKDKWKLFLRKGGGFIKSEVCLNLFIKRLQRFQKRPKSKEQ